MKLFQSFRPLLRVVRELNRIANSLEYFAIQDARRHNAIYMVNRPKFSKDESELFHTVDHEMVAFREEEHKKFIETGVEDE